QPALPRGDCLARMFRQNFICYSTAVVRRDVFEHVGRFDGRYELAVDYDFWLRAARHYEFEYVDEPLVKYRTGHANLSRGSAARLRVAMAIMRRAECELGHAAKVPAAERRLAWSETYASLAYAVRHESPLRAVGWQLRSLAAGPKRPGAVARSLVAVVKHA